MKESKNEGEELVDRLISQILDKGEYDLPITLGDFLETAVVGPHFGNGIVATGHWVPHQEWDIDYADLLEGHIEEKRLEELLNGSPPTSEEVGLWRELYSEAVVGGESGLFGTDLWQVTDSRGRSIYVISVRGDAGEVLDYRGPFLSTADAEDCLSKEGTVTAWTEV
jgi:hypothetical protein